MKNKTGLAKDHLSFTQIKDYVECPRFYYLKYHEGKKPADNLPMQFGSLQHAVVAKINEAIKTTKEDLSYEEVENIYKAEAAGYHLDPETYSRGKENMRAYALKTVAEKAIILESEYKFRHELEDGAIIEGRIDRIDIPGPDTMEVIDFKSSALIPSTEELRRDFQLRIYAYVALKLQPDIKIIKVARQSLETHVEENGEVKGGYKKTTEIDITQLEDTGEYLQMIWDKIKAEKEWKPNPEIEGACRYCPERCKDYAALARERIDAIDPDDIQAVGKQFITATAQISLITANQKACKKILKAHFEDNLNTEIEIGDKVIYASQAHKDEEKTIRAAYDYTKISIGKNIKSGFAIDKIAKALRKAGRTGTAKKTRSYK